MADVCPHGKPYGGIEQCGECRASAGSAIASSSPKADTSKARKAAAEYRLREFALWDAAKATWLDDPNATAKLSAESGKWAGRADDIEMRILEMEHEQWLVDQKRKMESRD